MEILTKEIKFFPRVFYFSYILGTIFDNYNIQYFSGLAILYTLGNSYCKVYVPKCIFIIIQRDKNGYAS